MRKVVAVAALSISSTISALAWDPHSSVREFTDAKVFLMTVTGKFIDGTTAIGIAEPLLYMGCRDNNEIIGISLSGFVLNDEVRDIEYRSDKGPIKEFRIAVRKGDTAYIGPRDLVRSFVEVAMSGEVLMVRTFAYDGAPVLAKFTVSGAKDALKRVEAECGWIE